MIKNLTLFLFVTLVSSLFGSITSYAVKPTADIARIGGNIKGQISHCAGNSGGLMVYIPGTSFSAFTDPVGNYNMSYVQPGTYDLIVMQASYRLGIVPSVVVNEKSTTEIGVTSLCPDFDNDSYDQSQDCNDSNPSINPGAQEVCDDGIDNNCNGTTDEGCITCTDNDGDSFFAQLGCGTQVDCNDFSSAINPSASEICSDGVDNNCNGEMDEPGSMGELTFYRDFDGDGFGDINTTITACLPPSGYIQQGSDCNDSDTDINPGAIEFCDGLDNNCDGLVDNNCTASSCPARYCDADNDPTNGCEFPLDTQPGCSIAEATNIGEVSGDTGSNVISFNGTGDTWLKFYVREDDSSLFCEDLSASITLSIPEGTNYDMTVQCDGCSSSIVDATSGSSNVEQVNVKWEEDCILGVPTGTDSGRDVIIHVEYVDANICDNWNITVRGNVTVSQNTCPAK